MEPESTENFDIRTACEPGYKYVITGSKDSDTQSSENKFNTHPGSCVPITCNIPPLYTEGVVIATETGRTPTFTYGGEKVYMQEKPSDNENIPFENSKTEGNHGKGYFYNDLFDATTDYYCSGEKDILTLKCYDGIINKCHESPELCYTDGKGGKIPPRRACV